jgi:hypothetical protein
MLKKTIVFFSFMTAISTQAAVLDVQCQAPGIAGTIAKTLNVTIAIDNVYSKYEFTNITLNGLKRDNLYMTDQKLEALDTNGSFLISTSHEINSKNILKLGLNVENCKDAILNRGVAASDEYIGGFDARKATNFTCSCRLK